MKLKELANQLNMLAKEYGDSPVLMYDDVEEAMSVARGIKLCTPAEASENFYCKGDNPVDYDERLKAVKNVIVLVG